MSTARQFEIVYQLLLRPRATARELAERLGVSERTVYRDIEALSAAGVPVYATPGKGGGFALLEDYMLPRSLFSPQEQEALLSALMALPGQTGESALTKLRALFRRQDPGWLQVDLTPWGPGGGESPKFQLLREAILARRQVSFTYLDSSSQPTARQVLPARLVFKGRAWYLQGYCLTREDYRTFRLSRMRDLADTGKVFHRPLTPPPIDPAGELPPLFRVELELRFSPAAASRVLDEFGEGCRVEEEPGGSFRVGVTFPQGEWVLGYLLSFGDKVEVLSPPWMAQLLAQEGEKIAARRANPDRGCQGAGGILEASHT